MLFKNSKLNFLLKISLILSLLIFTVFSLTNYSSAAPLTTITTSLSSSTVAPGENVTVNVDFGSNMGAYTVDVAYDSSLFDYVSSNGGTVNNDGTKVRLFFFDATGGTSPRTDMSVTFKAKNNLINTNPTSFNITANGLANSDASVSYDDIVTPIVQNVTIMPNYESYNISLDYAGNVVKDEAKDMKLSITSSLGESFSNTRVIAEMTTTSSGTATLTAIDSTNTTVDILADGFGSTAGDSIGGINVSKQIDLEGMFTENGTYTLTFKLIDKTNGDAVISQNSFNITVADEIVVTPPTEPAPEIPEELPKTGVTIYAYIIPVIGILILSLIILVIKKKEKSKY